MTESDVGDPGEPIPLDAFVDETRRMIEPPRRSRYGRLPFSHLDDPGPEFAFIIEDFLSAGDVSVIGGESGSGKSFLAIKAGMCIATGTPFFGREVEKPGLVIYQAGEGALGIKKRLRAYRQHAGIDPHAEIAFELLTGTIDLYRPDADTGPLIEEINWIAEEWATRGIPLVAIFVDTLVTATAGADENSGKDMTTVLANIRRIAKECRTHVCLVHHMNAGGEKLRGHTSIRANIDQVIVVKRNKDTGIRTAILDKQKDEEDGRTFTFSLMKVELGETRKGKPISSCVCLPTDEKNAELLASREGMLKLGPSFELAMVSLVTALKGKGRRPPPAIDCPGWAEAVTLTEWRDEFSKLKAGEDEDEEKLKERVKKARDRAVERFVPLNLIGKNGEWVWRTKRRIVGIDRPIMRWPTVEHQHPDLIDDTGMPQDANGEVTF